MNFEHHHVDGEGLIDPDLLQSWTSAVSRVAGERCGTLFAAALKRTLQRTLTRLEDGTVFVITGDIPAMWLRDSTTQLLPYLRLVESDPGGELAGVLGAVVRRQMTLIDHDPYANAFNLEPNGRCHDPADLSDDPWLWERKYEIDSLCFPFLLAFRLWQVTGRTDHLDGAFAGAFRAAVATLSRETRHEERSDYRFVRRGGPASETLSRDGLGAPVGWTGMSWSGFRPSDDACTLGYNVPGNLMAAHTLQQTAAMCRTVFADRQLDELAAAVSEADQLSVQICGGVERYGVVEHPQHGEVFAYEVDGLDHRVLMDDANMPSLLSLPLTSAVALDDPLYVRTRTLVLSEENPHFYRGRVASGIGSPHTPDRHVWPIALAVEGLTDPSPGRQLELLRLIVSTAAGTDHIHESFHADDDTVFTRPWFSWADAMFCALAMQVATPSG